MPANAKAEIAPVSVLVSADGNRDLLGNDRRIEYAVIGVAHHQLQRMPSRWQIELSLCLSGAEVQMGPVGWNRLARPEGYIDIDENMMVAGIGHARTGWCNTHVAQSESAPKRRLHPVSVMWPDDVDLCI